MIRLVYCVLLVAAAPLWLSWAWLRTRRRSQPPDWGQRFGKYRIPQQKDQRVWIHAVSVGEVMAARPILRELRSTMPDLDIVLSCTTSTGHSVASTLLPVLADHVIYFPVDLPWVCNRAMKRIRPNVVAIMETELWMNFLSSATNHGARTLIINGRLSERSYSTARRFRWFYKRLLSLVTSVLVQTSGDAERFVKLGANTATVVGNSKYDDIDEPLSSAEWRTLLDITPDDKLLVVGSVRGEIEEDLILSAIAGIEARVLLAPRHIERTERILAKAADRGFTAGRRSLGQFDSQLLVLDTFGELAGSYASADLAIVGGGFDRLGGQNIIQPMAAGCPVVCGPHMKNFREPFEQGVAVGAIAVADTAQALRATVGALLSDEPRCRAMGEAGERLVYANRGAATKYAGAIVEAAAASRGRS